MRPTLTPKSLDESIKKIEKVLKKSSRSPRRARVLDPSACSPPRLHFNFSLRSPFPGSTRRCERRKNFRFPSKGGKSSLRTVFFPFHSTRFMIQHTQHSSSHCQPVHSLSSCRFVCLQAKQANTHHDKRLIPHRGAGNMSEGLEEGRIRWQFEQKRDLANYLLAMLNCRCVPHSPPVWPNPTHVTGRRGGERENV